MSAYRGCMFGLPAGIVLWIAILVLIWVIFP